MSVEMNFRTIRLIEFRLEIVIVEEQEKINDEQGIQL